MGASFTSLSSILIELVNASDPSVGLGVLSSNQEWAKALEFYPLFVLADATVARAICNTKGLGARKTFLVGTQSGIANGAQLSSMVGPVETLQFVISGGRWAGTHPATPPRGLSLQEQLMWLRAETQNATANPAIEPHAVIDGDTVFHNGAGLVVGGAASVSLNATFCTFTINFSATSTQVPDEYARAVAIMALALYFAKDAAKTETAAYFNGLAQAELTILGIPTGQAQAA